MSISKIDRPREKLVQRGVMALSTEELLQLLLGSGTKRTPVAILAKQVTKFMESDIPQLSDLTKLSGLGLGKACTVLAAFELGRRHFSAEVQNPITDKQSLIARVGYLRHKNREHLVVVTVDGSRLPIKTHLIAVGTKDATLVHPREIFAPAISDRAAAIYVAHNHTSANPQPSLEDTHVTTRLVEAGNLLGIPVLDHVIVTKAGSYSFAEHGDL